MGGSFSVRCPAGIDAALVKADFFCSQAHTRTIENGIEQAFQNTKVASAKVAFDTVRFLAVPMEPAYEESFSRAPVVLLPN